MNPCRQCDSLTVLDRTDPDFLLCRPCRRLLVRTNPRIPKPFHDRVFKPAKFNETYLNRLNNL